MRAEDRPERRNLRALFAAVPLGIAVCLGLGVILGVIAVIFARAGLAEILAAFGFAALLATFALPLAFMAGFLFGLPVAPWLERHIMAGWVPVFTAVWGALWGYVMSVGIWSAIFGWAPDWRAHATAALLGSPFGLCVGFCWWYLCRRLECGDTAKAD